MKNIIVFGGGTAGWLTALYIKKLYNEVSIILIESSKVGILGAGEGSVPLLPSFLRDILNIDMDEFRDACDVTFKLGISFENWNGDGEKYLHGFGAPSGTPLDYIQPNILDASFNSALLVLNTLANNEDLNEVIPEHKVITEKKSFLYEDNGEIKKSTGHSFHFNARKVADYLRMVGESRGIIVIDGEFDKVILNQKDYIEGILLQDGRYFESDFVFDCSGFQRLLIGKLYNTEWISYEKYLTVNSAIPFFLPQTEKVIRPETRAIAMKYGWMWQIPVKGRWGCGYIYDDRFIDEIQAKAEVEEFLGHSIESPKTFKFNAGRYKEVWKNNCIAVGLSSGFTEPLEATSVMIALMQLTNLDFSSLKTDNQSIRDVYNNFVAEVNDEVVVFLYYHYMTQRKDTEFWSTYANRTEIPEKLKKVLDVWKVRSPKNIDLNLIGKHVFGLYSWYLVGAGIKIFDLELFKKENEDLDLDAKLDYFKYQLKTNLETILSTSFDNIQGE
jgi:tryptophan halogenase